MYFLSYGLQRKACGVMVKLMVVMVEVMGSIPTESSNHFIHKRGATWHLLIGPCGTF